MRATCVSEAGKGRRGAGIGVMPRGRKMRKVSSGNSRQSIERGGRKTRRK